MVYIANQVVLYCTIIVFVAFKAYNEFVSDNAGAFKIMDDIFLFAYITFSLAIGLFVLNVINHKKYGKMRIRLREIGRADPNYKELVRHNVLCLIIASILLAGFLIAGITGKASFDANYPDNLATVYLSDAGVSIDNNLKVRDSGVVGEYLAERYGKSGDGRTHNPELHVCCRKDTAFKSVLKYIWPILEKHKIKKIHLSIHGKNTIESIQIYHYERTLIRFFMLTIYNDGEKYARAGMKILHNDAEITEHLKEVQKDYLPPESDKSRKLDVQLNPLDNVKIDKVIRLANLVKKSGTEPLFVVGRE